MKLADSKTARSESVLMMALVGQRKEAQETIAQLLRVYPSDTFLNSMRAPLVRGSLQLANGEAEQALQTLESVRPCDFGWEARLFSSYLRGTVFLQLRKAADSATEFKNVLNHRGVDPMATEWEMAHLGLARAYAMEGKLAESRAAYQDFLTLWKDADPDIPVLKQAKAEYSKLK